jgi:hypothetical protein
MMRRQLMQYSVQLKKADAERPAITIRIYGLTDNANRDIGPDQTQEVTPATVSSLLIGLFRSRV